MARMSNITANIFVLDALPDIQVFETPYHFGLVALKISQTRSTVRALILIKIMLTKGNEFLLEDSLTEGPQ